MIEVQVKTFGVNNMRKLTVLSILILSFGLSSSLLAKEENRQSGIETSEEHKSEQGLEKGKAYAGTKEVTEKEGKDEKEKKGKNKAKKSEDEDSEDESSEDVSSEDEERKDDG